MDTISAAYAWKLRTISLLIATLIAGALAKQALAQQQPEKPPASATQKSLNDAKSILDLDIDQLAKVDVRTPAMNIEVTSVERQKGTVGRSAAAIFVVTQEMIQRSGVNTIPDVLRLVPGLHVAQVDAYSWVVTARGFSGAYSDKLLVLIDGRTVYSPIFAGVYWDVQDMLLEDIERIEVIRGPGGTLWGANAVNGVINIITKKAKDTQGLLATYGGGSQDRALGGARYGAKIGDDLYYRVYVKQFERAGNYAPLQDWYNMVPGYYDNCQQGRLGFRSEWEADQSNTLTVQGDAYAGSEGFLNCVTQPHTPSTPSANLDVTGEDSISGGNLLAHWKHTISDDSDWDVQAYYDRTERDHPVIWEQQSVSTFDAEFQHRFPLGQRNEIIWGADYRQIHDEESTDNWSVRFDPLELTTSLYAMFVQDQVTLVEDTLFFTVGSKFEHNDYSGFEYQPSARLSYAIDKQHTVWSAISRAVRTPSRMDQYGGITAKIGDLPSGVYQRIQGNELFQAEDLTAYEIGYRGQPDPKYSYDIAMFYNMYDNLSALRQGAPYQDPDYPMNFIVPLDVVNAASARTYGVELATQYALTDYWRLSGSYTYLRIDGESAPGTMPGLWSEFTNSPRNEANLMSSWDLGRRWQLDAILRYVDRLPASFTESSVPSYTTADLRLAWQPNKRLELAVIGRNLLQNEHLEFRQKIHTCVYTEVTRSVFGKVTYRY